MERKENKATESTSYSGPTMKIIKLKKLPRWLYTSPLAILSESQAIIWATGRGAEVLYVFNDQWIVRMDGKEEE